MSLRWKKKPPLHGLDAVLHPGHRGSLLRLGGRKVGSTSRLSRAEDEWFWVAGFDRAEDEWFWVAGFDLIGKVPWRNTCREPVATEELAKWDCEAYVREHLKLPPPRRPRPEQGEP